MIIVEAKQKNFFQRLYADGIISYECELYNLDTDSLPALKFLLNKIKNKDDILYKINYERKS